MEEKCFFCRESKDEMEVLYELNVCFKCKIDNFFPCAECGEAIFPNEIFFAFDDGYCSSCLDKVLREEDPMVLFQHAWR